MTDPYNHITHVIDTKAVNAALSKGESPDAVSPRRGRQPALEGRCQHQWIKVHGRCELCSADVFDYVDALEAEVAELKMVLRERADYIRGFEEEAATEVAALREQLAQATSGKLGENVPAGSGQQTD